MEPSMIRFAVALAVAALASLLPQAAAANDTARAGLAAAAASAKKWQSDAALVSVSTLAADASGRAAKWDYLFHSPKATQGYSVEIKGGKIAGTLEVRPHVKDPVGQEFVDSGQAMAEAKKNGLVLKGKAAMSLIVMGQATAKPGPYWSVVGGYDTNDVSVVLEGRTGKFAYSQKMP